MQGNCICSARWIPWFQVTNDRIQKRRTWNKTLAVKFLDIPRARINMRLNEINVAHDTNKQTKPSLMRFILVLYHQCLLLVSICWQTQKLLPKTIHVTKSMDCKHISPAYPLACSVGNIRAHLKHKFDNANSMRSKQSRFANIQSSLPCPMTDKKNLSIQKNCNCGWIPRNRLQIEHGTHNNSNHDRTILKYDGWTSQNHWSKCRGI